MKSVPEDARHGLDLLRRAVIKVLEDHGRLEKGKIREYLGLRNVKGKYARSNSLVEGVLAYLDDEGLVDHVPNEGWKLI